MLKLLRVDRGVGSGIITGGVVKVFALGTNVIAMPIALRALQRDRFGIFLMLLGIAQWVTLGNFGMQTSVARLIAGESVKKEWLSKLIGAGLALASFTAVILATVCALIIAHWLRGEGASLDVSRGEIISASALLLILMVLKTVLQTFSGVQIGTLNISIVNVFRMIGQLSVFVLLVVVAISWHTVAGFVLAVVGGLLVGDVLTAAHVLRHVQPKIRPWRHFYKIVRQLVSTGMAFTLINMVAFGSTGFPVFWVGALTSPSEAAPFGLLMRIFGILIGLLSVINAPLWPAILDAWKKRDYRWAKEAVRQFLFFELAVGVCSAVVVTFWINDFLFLWTQTKFDIDFLYSASFGLLLFQGTMAYFWGVVLIGLKREWIVAIMQLIRFTVFLIVGYIAIPSQGGRGAMLALTAGYALAETFILPICVQVIFKSNIKVRCSAEF